MHDETYNVRFDKWFNLYSMKDLNAAKDSVMSLSIMQQCLLLAPTNWLPALLVRLLLPKVSLQYAERPSR